MIEPNLKVDLNSEKMLLHQISMGNEKAFSTFFHRNNSKVYSYALKIIKSESLAEEITQEVFVKIWNLNVKLNEIESIDAYLRILTRNHTLNVLRRLALELKTNKITTKDYQESHNDTEDYIIFKDSEKILNQGIEKLPPQQKLIYNLCHKEGLKYEEVANKLNISKLTVKTHMQHALRFLRNYVSTHTDIAVFIILMTFLNRRN